MPFLNISTYRFVELDDLPALRDRLETRADAAGVKGTMLIAHEGINLFMAGQETALRDWVEPARCTPSRRSPAWPPRTASATRCRSSA